MVFHERCQGKITVLQSCCAAVLPSKTYNAIQLTNALLNHNAVALQHRPNRITAALSFGCNTAAPLFRDPLNVLTRASIDLDDIPFLKE